MDLFKESQIADRLDKDCKKAFIKWSEKARKLSPEDWDKLLLTHIKDPETRVAVASIIWWEHFGGLPATDERTVLNDYLDLYNPDTEMDLNEVRKALRKIGYPQSKAAERTMLKVTLFRKSKEEKS